MKRYFDAKKAQKSGVKSGKGESKVGSPSESGPELLQNVDG